MNREELDRAICAVLLTRGIDIWDDYMKATSKKGKK